MNIRTKIDHLQKRLQSRWRQFRHRSLRAKKVDTDLAMAQVMGARETKRLPSKQQIKHLPRLLSKQERTVALIAISLVLISGFFLARHLTDAQRITIPDVGGTYVEGVVGSPQLINPLYSSISDVDADISRLVFGGLMTYDTRDGLTTDLAEFYEISEDGTQYTFILRDDARWHDGQRVLADDVIFTINAILNPDYRSPLQGQFANVAVEQIDDRTVRFTLSEAHAPFLAALTIGILPSHIWQNISPINATLTELNTKPIGSGPYEFEKFVKDSKGTVVSYTLIRHSDYHGRAPYLDTLTLKFYPSNDAAIDALRNHNVEGVGFLPPALAQDIIETQSGQLLTASMTQYTAAFFNLNNTILSDEAVRQALVKATDTQAIIHEALYGYGVEIDSLIVSGLLGDYEGAPIAYDVSGAQELLVSAGWALTGSEPTSEPAEETDGEMTEGEPDDETVSTPVEEPSEPSNIRKKNDTTLSLELVTLDTQELRTVAQMLKQQWEEIGVSLTITAVDSNTLHNTILKNRDYDILLSGELYRIDPDLYAFWHSSQTDFPGLNISGYENPDVDVLIAQARTTHDEQERIELYQQIQEAITADNPAVLLYQPLYTYFVSEDLQGVELSSIVSPADRFSRIQDWYIKTRKVFE